MAIGDKILQFFGVERRASLNNPSGWGSASWLDSLFGGGDTRSGIAVNSETSLSHSAVYACTKVLAESVASLPFELFQRDDSGDTNPAYNHSGYNLVHSEPSQLYTAYDFFSTGMVHLCLHGNFYAEIIRNGNNRPTELRIVPPNCIEPYVSNSGELWYKIEGRELFTPAKNIFHVKGLSSDGITGKNPIQIFRENIGLGIAATQTAASLWKNGTLASGYLKHPTKLTPEGAKQLRETWASRYSGTDNAGRVIVLENGMEYTPLSLKPADAQFIETQKLSAEQIASIYRVPLHLIGNLDRATFSNIEQQSLEFVKFSLRPWLKNFEQEADRKLLAQSEKNTYFHRFNLDALLRGDSKARAEYYRTLFGIGVLSQNEIRRMENLNSIQSGDAFFVPLNMIDSETGAKQTDTENDTSTGEGNASGAN